MTCRHALCLTVSTVLNLTAAHDTMLLYDMKVHEITIQKQTHTHSERWRGTDAFSGVLWANADYSHLFTVILLSRNVRFVWLEKVGHVICAGKRII